MKIALALMLVVAGGCGQAALTTFNSDTSSIVVVTGKHAAAAVAKIPRRWQLWSVDAVSDRNLKFRWRDSFDAQYKGAKYMLYDEQNWRGIAQIVDQAASDCDHCAGPLVDAVLINGPGCADKLYGNTRHTCYAVGPVTDAEVANAKYAYSAWRDQYYRVTSVPELSDDWKASLTVTLDTRATVNEVQRCGRWESSGCVAHSVCSEVCTGIAVGDAESLHLQLSRDSITCQSFIPDLVDCPP